MHGYTHKTEAALFCWKRVANSRDRQGQSKNEFEICMYEATRRDFAGFVCKGKQKVHHKIVRSFGSENTPLRSSIVHNTYPACAAAVLTMPIKWLWAEAVAPPNAVGYNRSHGERGGCVKLLFTKASILCH